MDYQGPLPTSFVVSNGSVTIKFGHRNDGNHIEVRDTARGFDVSQLILPINELNPMLFAPNLPCGNYRIWKGLNKCTFRFSII